MDAKSKQGAFVLVGAIALALSSSSCDRGADGEGGGNEGDLTVVRSELPATCTSSTVKVIDLHADFREIWKGSETADTGKQADPNLKVGIDFNTTVVPAQVTAQFVPVKTDGSCGPTVPATLASSLTASQVWGTVTTDSARAPVPSAFNVLVRDGITGIVSAAGPIAAGGDVALSSMSVNGTAHQPVGLIAGGKVTVSNGSVYGNVTYGVASTIPQTVTVSGTKTLQPFVTTAAFESLASLSVLLAEETPTGTATTSNGTLQMTGSNSTLNVFQVSADVLSKASTVSLSVPANAATIVNVTGNMTVSLQNKGFTVQGATAATLLWNIPSAAFVQIAGIALQGSILAPRSLVTFDSGSMNGTLVAMAFASSGSGSLLSAPLNVAKLFPATTPSLVRLTPAQPLVRGCSYQFVVPGTVPLTAAGACLSPPIGVTFRVSTVAAPPSGRELTSVEPDLGLHTLRRFTARKGVNTPVDDVWARYESAIGIPAANLVQTTTSAPSSTRTGQTVTVYQQYAQGYPVAGYGYFVSTEGGLFRAANGKVMPGLPVFPSPAVTSATALQTALTFLKISPAPWVSNPTSNKAPVGRLIVKPKKGSPTVGADFALAWDFRFGAGTGILTTAGIQVDAATGTVLAVDDGEMAFATLNSKAVYVGQVDSTVDTIYNGKGVPFKVASYRNLDGSLVTTLASGDVNVPAGVLSTVAGVSEDPNGKPVGTLLNIVDPSPATPWVGTDPLEQAEQRMATLQWALEQSHGFMQSLDLRIGGGRWQNVDGATPRQKVQINYVDGPNVAFNNQAHYSIGASTPDLGQIFIYNDPLMHPFAAVAIGHEYNHLLVHNLREAAGLMGTNGYSTLATYNEAASIGEGLADLFGIAMNHGKVTQTATPWYCVELDQGKGPECLRNVADPLASTDNPLGGTTTSGQPNMYMDVANHYGDYSSTPSALCNGTNDRCGSHLNSTIVSHWGYLLGIGATASAGPCGLTVAPLDPDPDKSLRMVLNLALKAVSSKTALSTGGLVANASFTDFRDATLQTAEELIADCAVNPDSCALPADALPKIELAWAAVGLPPLASHPTVAAPANQRDVYPWTTFTWPVDGDGQSGGSWDFQLYRTTLAPAALAFSKDGISTPGPDNMTRVLPLSLPYGVSDTFYWRVRPNATTPWLNCYPIRSFSGTTVPDTVTNPKAVAQLDPDTGKVLPGTFKVAWDFVRGPVTYDAFIAESDAQCQLGDGVTQINALTDSDDGVRVTRYMAFAVQPSTKYFLNVRPQGPPGFAGAPSPGSCATLEFETAPMQPPTVVDAIRQEVFVQPIEGRFNWKTSGWAAKSQVRIYGLDADGKCAADPIDTIDVTICGADTCSMGVVLPLDGDALPNYSGYCWDVVDVATNGEKSAPSDKNKNQVTFTASTFDLAPGSSYGDALNRKDPGSLPGDSYDQPVPFSWTTGKNFSSAPQYGIKVGRFFWPQTLAEPEPPTCWDTNTSLNLCLRGAEDELVTTVIGADHVDDLPVEQVARGRYCWGVWPIFEDPEHPGDENPVQPRVDFPLQCYTTGPARPRIVVPPGLYSTDPKVPPAGYSPEPITGQMELDYIPDSQLKGHFFVNGTETMQFDVKGHCPIDNNGTYKDVYDCTIPFTISGPAAESTTFKIVLETFNSTKYEDDGKGHSDPVMDASTMIPDPTTMTITTGPCGDLKQSCCEQNWCDQGLCKAGKCLDSAVTITSPAGDAKSVKFMSFNVGWKDDNPPASYMVTAWDDNGYSFTDTQPAWGNASTEQYFSFPGTFETIYNEAPWAVTVCPVLPNGTGKCATLRINQPPPPQPPKPPQPPQPPQPTPSCSPPVVPTVTHCEGPLDPVNVNFKPVPGALKYTVEYKRQDNTTFTREYDASTIMGDFGVDSKGNLVMPPVWYSNSPDDFEPSFTGSFHVSVVTANCQSTWSALSYFDNSGSAACMSSGYCAFGCAYHAPIPD